MALLSEIVKRIAEVEGIDQTYAAGVARYLREAGEVSQAGRGRGAAHMTSRDVASLLIGLNVSRVAKEAAKETLEFKLHTQSWDNNQTYNGICSKGNTLQDDLRSIIDLASDETFRDMLSRRQIEIAVQFHLPVKYTILSVTRVERRKDDEPLEFKLCSGLYGSVWPRGPWNKQPDRTDIVIISARTIIAVAEHLSG